MALGSVSISTFIPGELEDLTGTVSIIPFTRAEIERLANKKAYPNGKVVWSATVNASSTTNVPDDVDDITISVGDSPVKVARGGSAQWTDTIYYARFLAHAHILFIIPQSFLTQELLRSHSPVKSISAAVHTNSQATTTTDPAATKSSPGVGAAQKKGRVLYRYQRIFHVPGLHPAALTQLPSAGVRLQGQRRRAPRRRAGGAATVHPGALRQAGTHHQRLPHRRPQRRRGRQQVQPAPAGPGGGLLR